MNRQDAGADVGRQSAMIASMNAPRVPVVLIALATLPILPALPTVAAPGAVPATTTTGRTAEAPRSVLPFIADDYTRAVAEARARKVPLFIEAWAPW